MKSYGGGSFFSIKRQDVLETTEQLSQERRYPVLKIDRQSQNFTLFKIQVLKRHKNKKKQFSTRKWQKKQKFESFLPKQLDFHDFRNQKPK